MSGAARRGNTRRTRVATGGVEGTCRRGTRRARATRGGQLRRRASGDRALKGPTPHAPSSCQLSFLSSSPSSSFPLSHSFFLFLSLSLSFPLSALAAQMRLSSFSSCLFLHMSFLSFLILLRPLTFISFILTNYTALRVSSTFTKFPQLILPFPDISSSHDPSLSPSVVAVAVDQPPRHARPSRFEPRRRVSRFKLTQQRAL